MEKKINIRTVVQEEYQKLVIENQSSYINAQRMLLQLVKSIQAGDDSVVDTRSLEAHTDGEILGQFIVPLLQSLRIKLKDPKGFDKYIKFKK